MSTILIYPYWNDRQVTQSGVIEIPKPSSLGLCAGVTNATYAGTTEVYPDSPQATPEQCNLAQVTPRKLFPAEKE